LHTDCYIYKRNGSIRELRLRVGRTSLMMLFKWKGILDFLTGKAHKIHKEGHYDKRFNKTWITFLVREGSKSTLGMLIQKLPVKNFHFDSDFSEWLQGKNLGPYLAGVIDGDGCIQIRKRYCDKGYERLLKIADKTSKKLIMLQQMLLKEGMPKGYITKYKNHNDLWIYINKEFKEWLKINVAPYLTAPHKIQKMYLECPGSVTA
jgi:hypothetical protein